MDDATLAYSCAANLLLYDEDPGERGTNVGSISESLIVDRRIALMQLYTQQLLVALDAEPARITVAQQVCEQEAEHALVGGHDEAAEVWDVALELAAAAARIMEESGADTDPKARDRLLAGTRHTLTHTVLGSMLPPELERRAAAELAEQLRRIDDSPTGT